MNKYAVISGFLGQMRDRFCVYGQERSIEEKFRLASQIEGVQGVEVVYPYDCPNTALLKELAEQHGLEIAAINLNLKGEPEFVTGSYTNTDPSVRKKAMEFTEGAVKAARELGCFLVTCCPLADGSDYAFDGDYRESWALLRDGIKQAARLDPDVKLSLEYKPSEPRVRCYLDRAATALCMCHDVDEENVGVTIDVGHAFCAKENPAQSVVLLGERERLFYVHINDNNGEWDWDLIPGSDHFWHLVEFLVYLRDYAHAGWLTADVMPARTGVVKTFSQTGRVIRLLEQIASELDLEHVRRLREGGGDVMDVYSQLWKAL